jgi:hypothetical protein
MLAIVSPDEMITDSGTAGNPESRPNVGLVFNQQLFAIVDNCLWITLRAGRYD